MLGFGAATGAREQPHQLDQFSAELAAPWAELSTVYNISKMQYFSQ